VKNVNGTLTMDFHSSNASDPTDADRFLRAIGGTNLFIDTFMLSTSSVVFRDLILTNSLALTNISGSVGSGFQLGFQMPPCTNIFYTNQTLDFPATLATNWSDLPAITNSIIGNGDIVSMGVVGGSVPQGGSYFPWCSNGGGNGVIWVRYIDNTAAGQNPASGVFKFKVEKF